MLLLLVARMVMLISGGTDKLLTVMMKVSAILILDDSGVTLTPS